MTVLRRRGFGGHVGHAITLTLQPNSLATPLRTARRSVPTCLMSKSFKTLASGELPKQSFAGGRILTAIRADFEDAQTCGVPRVDQFRLKRGVVFYHDMRHSMGGAQPGKINGLGRGKVALKRRIKLSHRKVFENTASAVVHEHDGQVSFQFVREHQAIAIMQKG